MSGWNPCQPFAIRSRSAENLSAESLREENEHQRPGLFSLPVEIRLQIFSSVVDIDHLKLKICPHHRLPLLVLTRRIESSHEFSYKKALRPPRAGEILPTLTPAYQNTPLSMLQINHQINEELSDLFVLYLEKCFSFFRNRHTHNLEPWNDPHSIGNVLKGYDPHIWEYLHRVGFSINQDFYYNAAVEVVAIERFKAGLAWMHKHMPNLKFTYPHLFAGAGRKPSDRFLIHLVRSLRSLRGQKFIHIYGSNRTKKAIANQWKAEVQDKAILVLGGCHCNAWVAPEECVYPRGGWLFGQPAIKADTLTDWFSSWSEDEGKTAQDGTPALKVCRQSKGPLIGCLLCWSKTHYKLKTVCNHDPKFNPARIVPTISFPGRPFVESPSPSLSKFS
ncbi:hypothetical protein MMC28_005049 [Mycoblastus sanguinarius]|nr:hypothetical protein [Mycoblastus sanguinarius]